MDRVLTGSFETKFKSAFRILKSAILICAMLFALCFSAEAQQTKKVPRIGFLSAGSANSMSGRVEAFRWGLREQGYTEGKNILVEHRYAEDKLDRLREFAEELARLKVDVIVTGGPIATRPAKETAGTIPIVLAYEADPIRTGLVASLARPGGNITGLSSNAEELIGKRLELLKEAIPKLSRVAVLRYQKAESNEPQWKESQLAARQLGLQLYSLEVSSADKYENAFKEAIKTGSTALAIVRHRLSQTPANQKRIIELAAKYRLPAIYYRDDFVDQGGLMSYGADDVEPFKRVAAMVDKILKGAKPADIPVEQSTKFEFVVNLKTAKQLGLTIPPDLLARANRVVK